MNAGSPIRLYLVRHGENPANITRVFSSRKVDHGLTEKGRLQAQQTAAHFAGLSIPPDQWIGRAVYSSPLKRAVETADIIAARLDLVVTVRDNFREIDVGRLEERPATAADWEFHQRVVGDWLDGRRDTRFPGGDDYHDLWARFSAGLQDISSRPAAPNALIVGHGGIFSAVLMDLVPGIDIEWLRASRWDNCAITELDLSRKEGRLEAQIVTWNDVDHLHGAAANLVPGVPSYTPRSSNR